MNVFHHKIAICRPFNTKKEFWSVTLFLEKTFDTDCRVIVVLKESVERTVMMVQEVHPEHPGRLVQLVPLELKANLDEEEQMEPQEKLDLLAFLAEREELVL